MANIYGRQVVQALTNKSGGGVIAGDVVIIDTGNDTAFTTTTTGRYKGSLGIAQETIANNATGRVLVAGHAALVNVPSSQTRGYFLETHTVAKQGTGSVIRRPGSFGQFLTGGSTPTAWLWGKPDTLEAYIQVVRATSTANDSTTSSTYADSSLSLAITPTSATAVLEIEVFGELNITRVSGSPADVLGWYQIYNSTDAASVTETIHGVNPGSEMANASVLYQSLAVRGFYTVNSTTTRTFKLRHKMNTATTTSSSIRGDRGGGVTMTIRELAG